MNRAHGLFTGEDWRDTVIQLYSFSKSYAIPGHRTGAIMADAGLIEQVAKILDCIQICAPRPAQAALPWAIEGLREWREGNRAEINRRIEVFPESHRRHFRNGGSNRSERISPICGIPSRVRPPSSVAERLAMERGVLCLPGQLFRTRTGRASPRRLRQCGRGRAGRPHGSAARVCRLRAHFRPSRKRACLAGMDQAQLLLVGGEILLVGASPFVTPLSDVLVGFPVLPPRGPPAAPGPSSGAAWLA